MMTIEQVLPTFLLGVDAINTATGGRVYQNRAPQDATYPLLVIRRLDTDPTDDLGGLASHASTIYRLEGQAKTYTEVVAIKNALRSITSYNWQSASLFRLDPLNMTRATFTRSTTATYDDPGDTRALPQNAEIQAILLLSDGDGWSEDPQLQIITMDVNILHTEPYREGY